ncbi:type VII secretion integral membrane protein EccD [Mycolicibacterium sp. BK556]|uniref:type VII secretion integral membrane protein EccD n=1 Tax=unclassified Mycolicibacterium TaxID=2636767 RepID=UPI00161E5CEA|nr:MULTISPECIES: type VII secretion integral membrane protein EccD [unclassified Mycolicibacterium]MBB3600491.1 type VII secretion integral membrane protein EccD [Mycolicibacterium sp. BK556]MBB3630244.1 type VII secretion integral membrane protein EccD [Mycolicibacterium sp. BK607]MBB3748244.1 type VII secretion integral membrane protein EccD [Mycolicibacterium sp. BK634]
MTETPVLPIVRVAVLAYGRITDVALPAELPLREILPAVKRLVPQPDSDVETSVPTPMTLAPIGGAPFSVDASLDTVGVVDGDLLALQPVPAGPSTPGVVEDIADAAVIFSAARTRPWGPHRLQLGARLAAALFVVALSAVAIAHRTATASVIGVYAVSALAVVAAVAGLLLRARSAQLATQVSAAALLPIAAAFWLAVPGLWGAPHVMLAAAGVAAWSLIVLTQTEDGVGLFTATAVVGVGSLLVAAATSLWQLPALTVGCALIVLALLITVSAPGFAAMWARFPLPVIPAPGDPTPSSPAARVLADLPRRVRVGEAHQTGLIAGTVLLSSAGSLVVAGRAEGPGAWGWYLVAAAVAAAVLRARVWDTAACKGWLLAQPFLVTGGLLVAYVVDQRFVPALWTVVALAVLTAVWVVVAVNPDTASAERYSLPVRRLVGFLAAGLDASLIPVAVYLVGIFTWVLDR